MNTIDAVNTLLQQIDFQGELDTIASDYIGRKAVIWLNMALEELYNASTDWSWNRFRSEIDGDGNADYELAATVDTNSIKTMTRTSDGRPLKYLEYWEFEEQVLARAALNYDNEERPMFYTVVGNTVSFYPALQTGTTVRFYHKKLPQVLTADDDDIIFPANYIFTTLIQVALFYAKLHSGDADASLQRQIADRAIKGMLAQNDRQRHKNPGMRPDDSVGRL